MGIKTNLPYPKDDYVELLKDFYTSINDKKTLKTAKSKD